VALPETITQPLVQKAIQAPFTGQHRIEIALLASYIDFIQAADPAQHFSLTGITVETYDNVRFVMFVRTVGTELIG
jgi:hypothetical protein